MSVEIKIDMRQHQHTMLATPKSILSSNNSSKMPKNYSKFNVSMQNEFYFLKPVASSESEVLCTLCDGKFSVADGGRTRINAHIKTQKHIKASKTVNTNQSISEFLADNDPLAMPLQGKELAFGSVNQNDENNVFFRLKKEFGRKIVGIGCIAHKIHNTFDSACSQLPFDFEALVVNIYKHFYIHTLRVEALKEFCNDSEEEFKKLTNLSGTRFLTLYHVVQKIIRMFAPLKIYFQGLTNCPVTIRRFFDDTSALFWLKFVCSQLALSNEYVLLTESKKITSFEVASKVFKLRDIIENRKQSEYISDEAAELLRGLTLSKQKESKQYVNSFYLELSSYLQKWSRSLYGTEVFMWMNLDALPVWEDDVKPSVKLFQQHFDHNAIKCDAVFNETLLLRQFVSENLRRWNEDRVPSELRWVETLKTLNQQNRPINQISLLVQYAFAIPGTSSDVERLFTVINDIWDPDKGQMLPSTLKALLNVKINSDQNCVEYYESIKNNKKLLAQVPSRDKYIQIDDDSENED